MDSWQQFIAIFISLFVITDPFGNVGIFLSITDGDDVTYRRAQALKGSIYSFFLMFVIFIGGTYIMEFFGITLDGIRIGGGLIVSRIGFSLLSPKEEDSHSVDEKEESKKKSDISFCPLALPLIAGPGALAVVSATAGTMDGVSADLVNLHRIVGHVVATGNRTSQMGQVALPSLHMTMKQVG